MKKRSRALATRLVGAMNKFSSEHKYLLDGTVSEIINGIPTVVISICNDVPENDYADEDYNNAVDALNYMEGKLGINNDAP